MVYIVYAFPPTAPPLFLTIMPPGPITVTTNTSYTLTCNVSMTPSIPNYNISLLWMDFTSGEVLMSNDSISIQSTAQLRSNILFSELQVTELADRDARLIIGCVANVVYLQNVEDGIINVIPVTSRSVNSVVIVNGIHKAAYNKILAVHIISLQTC